VGGPYEVLTKDEPLIEVNDASLFMDTDGRTYLLQTGITICEVDPDSARVLHDKVKVLLKNPEDGHWNSRINEGPCMLKKNGVYYLFWSATGWGYHVGYATSTQIYGPYKMNFNNPIYGASHPQYEAVSGEAEVCPFDELGHGTVFKGPDNRWWIASHGYSIEDSPYRKARLCIDPLNFNEETGEFTATPTWTEQRVVIPVPLEE
jgi:beta-xylosidase